MNFSEFHALQPGDRFTWEQGGEILTVADDSRMIDYHGDMLIFYYEGTHLHAHFSDHTPVWLI